MKYLLTGHETERLTFRLLQPEDFNTWVDLFKAKNSAKFLKLDPKLSEVELCKLWFDKCFHGSRRFVGSKTSRSNKRN